MGRVLLAAVVAVSLVAGACGAEDDGGTVTVFAAASLADVFAEVADAFEAEHGVAVTASFAGSSSLREQILEGAPADIFASASPAPMEALVAAGAVDEPVTFARNRLAIAVPAGNPAGVTGLQDLADPALLVGLCAPEVPCGDLARRVLADAGVAAEPDTEEPDVRALLTKIVEAELDAGLVYATDVAAAEGDVEGIALGDATTEYRIAVVDGADDPAADFVDFVLGERGQRILRDAGFESP